MGTRLYYVDYDNIKYIDAESEELKIMTRTNARLVKKEVAESFIFKKCASKKYYVHHTSRHAAYVQAGKAYICDYNGRFGKGYTIEYSDWRKSTQYSFLTYLIEN